MYEAASFDPSAKTSDTFNTNLPIGGKFIAFNESAIGLTFTFDDGETAYSPPGIAMIFQQPTPNPNVKWSQKNILTGSVALSQVTIECYQPNEQIIGVFPLNVEHQTFVGNTVQTNVAGTNSITNDGNPALTSIIEATQLGGPASNITADNTGNFQINQWDGVAKKLLFQTIANAAANTPSIKMLTAGLIAEVLGTLLIDNNIAINYKDNAGTARRILQVDNNNNLQFFGISGLDILQILSSGGVVQVSINTSNGNAVFNGTITDVNGQVRSVYMLATPIQLDNNGSINNGTTVAETVSPLGGGSGVPSGATAIILNVFFTSGSAGAYLQWKPNGASVTHVSDWPLIGQVEVANATVLGQVIIPVAANGKIDVTAHNANVTGVNSSIMGYII